MEPLRERDPRQVGAYSLQARLGGGGMGQVFLGRSRSGRPVAVKVLHAEVANDAGFRRRFAAEVEAARRVGGFYTAQVVDADPEADPPWLVTAYVAGPSLQEAVEARGPLPAETIAVLGAGLAEGLAAIHASGLVHRDLKPSNVILAEDGPRVIDFGIARALDATSHTLSRVVIGTPSFMSPEQARGDEIGPASDVFSLGLVLAFAATGRSPFGTGAHHALLYRIVHDEPDLTGVPAHLADLVRRCLAKEPAERPSVTGILDELADAARPATHWLPAPVTTMIAERSAHTPADPPPADPPTADPPTADPPTAVGTRVLETRVVTPPPPAVKPGNRTAIAAVVLALLCVPGLLTLIVQTTGFLDDPDAPTPVLWINLLLGAVESAVLAVGAVLLSQRKKTGRRLVVWGGVVVGLQCVSVRLQATLTGANVTMDSPFGTFIYIYAPLTAAAAIGAVAMALHPATRRLAR